jgi:phosphonate transport system ATP-binding protein
MLEVSNLSKALADGKRLLDDISFDINPGEFVALLGPSGAGKSLTLRCILGLTKADVGRVIFTNAKNEAIDLMELKGRARLNARRRIGVIFQGANLVKRLRVIENVMIGRLGFISPVRSWLYGFTDKEALLALEALDQVGMADYAHRFTGSLSGGEKQRVAIARAIHQQPDLFLADEPISSLDPANAEIIMELLVPLAKERPVLGVFHQPNFVARYCTRALALRAGVVVYNGPAKIKESELCTIYGQELESDALCIAQ